jgi:hypothetical protein
MASVINPLVLIRLPLSFFFFSFRADYKVVKPPSVDRKAKPDVWNHDVLLKIVAGVFGLGVLFIAAAIGTLAAYR